MRQKRNINAVNLTGEAISKLFICKGLRHYLIYSLLFDWPNVCNYNSVLLALAIREC